MTYSPNIPVPVFADMRKTNALKYKPAYCQVVLDTMAQGKSKKRVATELGVAEKTMYNWRDNFPDFAEALTVGEQLCSNAWEQMCLDETMGVDGAKVSGGAIMAMRNMLKWDTRDKDKSDVVAEAKAILEMGAQMTNKDWIKTYGPAAAAKLKSVKGKK